MKAIVCGLALTVGVAGVRGEAVPVARHVDLYCHRTANEDVPENTLESLEQAALLGCDVVEVDLRRTLDGELVLNHDGVLERLTDGTGEVETSFYGELALLDAGAWMGEQFAGMRIARLEDALRVARRRRIRLILDIKTKGIGPEVLHAVEYEGMLQRVQFNGEWADVKALYPAANAGSVTWVQPGVSGDEVAHAHQAGRVVIANFSATAHDMDLLAMKAAVSAGVDGINVDYPRVGAEAVGRPVEQTLRSLALQASEGQSARRTAAILEMARYRGFPRLQSEFERWLMDADPAVSRAAALALASARPRPALTVFAGGLRAERAHVRANSAWALGMLQAPARMLTPLLADGDAAVRQATLMALARGPGPTEATTLLGLLGDESPAVRGAAALALARHHPELAARAISDRVSVEVNADRVLYDDYVRRNKPPLTPAEIGRIMDAYRCQMKMMQALAMVPGAEATKALEEQAFRGGEDFARMNSVVAAFALWNRIGTDPARAVEELGSKDPGVADKAEWMLVQGGPDLLGWVRKAATAADPATRRRAVEVLAIEGDAEALAAVRSSADGSEGVKDLAARAPRISAGGSPAR